MIFQDFIHTVKDCTAEKLGADFRVSLQQVLKNNGVCYESLLIVRKGVNLSPMIYLNPYYHRYLNGMSIPDICEDICCVYHRKFPSFAMDTDFFLDYEKVRTRVVPKLIHYEKNKEMLADVPYIRLLDLAMVFLYLLDTSNIGISDPRYNYASILIRREHVELWHITTEYLYRDALRNAPILLPPEVKSMPELLKEFQVHCYDCSDDYEDDDEPEDDWAEDDREEGDDDSGISTDGGGTADGTGSDGSGDSANDNGEADGSGTNDGDSANGDGTDDSCIAAGSDIGSNNNDDDDDDDCSPIMYVVTNTLRINGAVSVLYEGLLEKIAECLDSNLVVLPSSIHEMILVPVGDIPRDELGGFQQMVQEVNATQVADDEVLSNNAYYYDVESDELTIL